MRLAHVQNVVASKVLAPLEQHGLEILHLPRRHCQPYTFEHYIFGQFVGWCFADGQTIALSCQSAPTGAQRGHGRAGRPRSGWGPGAAWSAQTGSQTAARAIAGHAIRTASPCRRHAEMHTSPKYLETLPVGTMTVHSHCMSRHKHAKACWRLLMQPLTRAYAHGPFTTTHQSSSLDEKRR